MDTDNRQNKAKRQIIVSICLIAFAMILSASARKVPGFADWYSHNVYPVIQGSLGRLSGIAPFSAAEMLCLILPALIILDAVRLIKKKRCKEFFTHLLMIASVLFFMYVANCGVNYYMQPFVERDALENAAFTEDELADFCEYAADRLTAMPECSYPEWDELSVEAIESMEKLSEKSAPVFNDYSSLSGYYPRPKKLTFMTRLFSMMGVSGIYSPFTIEANVNGEMMGLEKPFTACHELSHLRGFMNEGEANYIGWLACINSDHEAFNRSGWIIAWIYAGNSLYRTDPDRYESIKNKLPDDIIRELRENSEFWATHENKASEVQNQLNDAYLKSNGQEHGIQTYGQLTTLMLMWYSDMHD